MYSPIMLDQLADVVVADRLQLAARYPQRHQPSQRPARQIKQDARRQVDRLLRAGSRLTSEPVFAAECR
jgi:hypothetical protein